MTVTSLQLATLTFISCQTAAVADVTKQKASQVWGRPSGPGLDHPKISRMAGWAIVQLPHQYLSDVCDTNL